MNVALPADRACIPPPLRDRHHRLCDLPLAGALPVGAHGAEPSRMISILLAAPGIATDRLDVTRGSRANPHARPGRRDGERSDSRERLRITQKLAIGCQVTKAAPAPCARDAGHGVADIAQSSDGSRLHRIRGRIYGPIARLRLDSHE